MKPLGGGDGCDACKTPGRIPLTGDTWRALRGPRDRSRFSQQLWNPSSIRACSGSVPATTHTGHKSRPVLLPGLFPGELCVLFCSASSAEITASRYPDILRKSVFLSKRTAGAFVFYPGRSSGCLKQTNIRHYPPSPSQTELSSRCLRIKNLKP